VSGCSNCTTECYDCDEANAVCDGCVNNAEAINNTCQCNDGYVTDTNSEDFQCIYVCDEDCETCIEGEASNCLVCSQPHSTPDENGTCHCDTNFDTLSEGPLRCEECKGDCLECGTDPLDCTTCWDEEATAANGRCVCDSGFYPSSYTDDGEEYLLCKPCDSGCSKCDPDCFQCTDDSASSGDTCVETSLGYKLKFKKGVINILFSRDLELALEKYDFSVTGSDGMVYDTEKWDVDMVSYKEYNINTNLTRSALPIQVEFTFLKVDD